MTDYRCLVVNAAGQTEWRQLAAADPRAAAAALSASGLIPIEVRSGAPSIWERLQQPVRFGSSVGLSEQTLIMAQLATLVRSGLPVDRSIDLLRDQAPRKRQRALLAEMLARIRAGDSLATAMEGSGIFPAYVVGVIRSAEQSGQLAPALTSLATRLNAASATRAELITALTYPAVVLASTIMALITVLTVVVPQFEPIFAGQEAKLPWITRFVLVLADIFNRRGWILVALVAAAIIGAIALVRAASGNPALDPYRRRIPGVALRDQYLAAQFTGLMGMLVGNDVTVVRALGLVEGAIASKRWRTQIARVEQRIREGMRLSQALGEVSFVPVTAVRLIEVGERTGKLADTCLRASEIIGEAAKSRVQRIVSLANPIAIATLGAMVAMLVGGVMLGIFALGDFAQ